MKYAAGNQFINSPNPFFMKTLIVLKLQSLTRLLCLFVVAASLVATAHAKLMLTGVSMFGATNAEGAFNGSYDFWDTIGGDSAYNVYLFTGPTNSPNFLNSGDSDDSLNPRIDLTPGTHTYQFAIDSVDSDPPTPYLGINLFFDNDSTSNRITAVVGNGGSCNFSVVDQNTPTYGENGETSGSGSLSYTSGELTVTLTAFCISKATPVLVSGTDATPGSDSDFTGSFTLTVTGAGEAAPTGTSGQIEWPSSANSMYQVQWSTNAAEGTWSNAGEPIQGNGTTNYLFYRVVPVQQ
jgi:hypothetical protein